MHKNEKVSYVIQSNKGFGTNFLKKKPILSNISSINISYKSKRDLKSIANHMDENKELENMINGRIKSIETNQLDVIHSIHNANHLLLFKITF